MSAEDCFFLALDNRCQLRIQVELNETISDARKFVPGLTTL